MHRSLKGLSPALIAKVRAREARAAAAGLSGGSEMIKQRETVSRLPVMIEMLHSFFRMRGERRNACSLNDLTMTLAKQSTDSTVTRKDVQMQVMSLTERLPEWCSISQVGATKVFTITPAYPMADVRARVKEMAASLKQ